MGKRPILWRQNESKTLPLTASVSPAGSPTRYYARWERIYWPDKQSRIRWDRPKNGLHVQAWLVPLPDQWDRRWFRPASRGSQTNRYTILSHCHGSRTTPRRSVHRNRPSSHTLNSALVHRFRTVWIRCNSLPNRCTDRQNGTLSWYPRGTYIHTVLLLAIHTPRLLQIVSLVLLDLVHSNV